MGLVWRPPSGGSRCSVYLTLETSGDQMFCQVEVSWIPPGDPQLVIENFRVTSSVTNKEELSWISVVVHSFFLNFHLILFGCVWHGYMQCFSSCVGLCCGHMQSQHVLWSPVCELVSFSSIDKTASNLAVFSFICLAAQEYVVASRTLCENRCDVPRAHLHRSVTQYVFLPRACHAVWKASLGHFPSQPWH